MSILIIEALFDSSGLILRISEFWREFFSDTLSSLMLSIIIAGSSLIYSGDFFRDFSEDFLRDFSFVFLFDFSGSLLFRAFSSSPKLSLP